MRTIDKIIDKLDGEKFISFDLLPEEAKSFIAKYFYAGKIAYIEEDRELLRKSYEVKMEDGTEIDFNRNGEWDTIDCSKPKKIIPLGIVPPPILEYVRNNHSDQNVVKIERERNDYEVELENGIELTFDRNYVFMSR